MINFNHDKNIHSLKGATCAFQFLFPEKQPESLIDVGCGAGFWLATAQAAGVGRLLGLDGILADKPFVDKALIRQVDFSAPFFLKDQAKFEVALCLEVAEHIYERSALDFISSLVKLSDVIVFSAAIPAQPGQHHVNLQWPVYWQTIFNQNGYYCDDSIRWKIWNESLIEVWYRQNVFIARKDPAKAGLEPRILPVIHPEMLIYLSPGNQSVLRVAKGALSKAFATALSYIRAQAKAANARRGSRNRIN